MASSPRLPPNMSDPLDHEQAEPAHVSTSLEIEQLDANLFRSLRLFVPWRARGVYGGQVISQSLVAATKCVSPEYLLHSLHAYFLLSASASIPIIYCVESVREGKSYVTRSVRAVQGGKTVYFMLCSFHKPEPWQPSYQWSMPKVSSPEDSRDDTDILDTLAKQPGISARAAKWYEDYAEARRASPIAVRHPGGELVAQDGTRPFIYWMKTRETADYEASYQKCILAYLSDLHFLPSAATTLGLKRNSRGPGAVGMISSLDHSICYYNHDFTCNDWLLYVITSPVAGSGRGYVTGHLYSRSGKLLAVTTQEGVVRADLRAPDANSDKAKL